MDGMDLTKMEMIYTCRNKRFNSFFDVSVLMTFTVADDVNVKNIAADDDEDIVVQTLDHNAVSRCSSQMVQSSGCRISTVYYGIFF